jgi:hypothetical protein
MLPHPTQVAVKGHIQDIISSLCWLASNQTGGLFWNVKPKLHFLFHIGEQISQHNPYWLHTYQEEDLMGKMVRVGKACASGRSKLQIPAAILSKYRVFLALKWKGFV